MKGSAWPLIRKAITDPIFSKKKNLSDRDRLIKRLLHLIPRAAVNEASKEFLAGREPRFPAELVRRLWRIWSRYANCLDLENCDVAMERAIIRYAMFEAGENGTRSTSTRPRKRS